MFTLACGVLHSTIPLPRTTENKQTKRRKAQACDYSWTHSLVLRFLACADLGGVPVAVVSLSSECCSSLFSLALINSALCFFPLLLLSCSLHIYVSSSHFCRRLLTHAQVCTPGVSPFPSTHTHTSHSVVCSGLETAGAAPSLAPLKIITFPAFVSFTYCEYHGEGVP